MFSALNACEGSANEGGIRNRGKGEDFERETAGGFAQFCQEEKSGIVIVLKFCCLKIEDVTMTKQMNKYWPKINIRFIIM